jgi:hypothetical protein
MVSQKKKERIMAITGGFGRDRDLSKNPLNKEEVKRFTKEKRF